MKINNSHLTYCTNIHAGESWPDHFAALKKFFPAIRKSLFSDTEMGIGLRLSNEASEVLVRNENMNAFREWLQQEKGYVFTMNGFPYGGFHHTRVKEHVHSPDWIAEERVRYTIRLFDILLKLLPDGLDGGISTSPLSYRHWFKDEAGKEKALHTATANIIRVVQYLIEIRNSTGVILHLDIEPEPDGLLESGDEFIHWFEGMLSKLAVPAITLANSVTTAVAGHLLRDHLRLCYDVCHFAVGYEPHAAIIKKLSASGIKIGKIQISAALKAMMDSDGKKREEIVKAFAVFNESTYLHQVVAKEQNGTLLRYPDLPEALADAYRTETKEWRAHFHVPVFKEDFGVLQSTQQDIREVLAIHHQWPVTNHLEVETYTWEVLPEMVRLPLLESIIREMEWVKQICTENLKG